MKHLLAPLLVPVFIVLVAACSQKETEQGISHDKTMPQVSAQREFSNERELQRAVRIAEIEKSLSELAMKEGRVYRGLWFWSQFRDPRAMRTVFRGNRTVPFTAKEGAIYFHNGYPLERGNVDQMAVLTAWVRVYAAMCDSFLPAATDKLKIHTFTTSGTLLNRTTNLTNTDVLQFQTGLMEPYIASREAFQQKQKAALQNNLWSRASEIVSGGMGAVSRQAQIENGPYIYALEDFSRFIDTVGCDSPSARQMAHGIALVAHDLSLADGSADGTIEGAERVSDTPQAPGEYRAHSEVCWDYEITSHNPCGCLVEIAKEKLAEGREIPANIDYRLVHKAFMQSSEAEQKICRDPLSAISAGLL